MTDVLMPWDTFFGGDLSQLFRGQFGSCLVMDYTGTVDWSQWTPFEATTGEIKSTFYQNGVFDDGWNDLGYGDKTGLKFQRTLTASNSDLWQSRRENDPSITKDAESGTFTAMQSNPIIDALRDNLPLASVPHVGAAGYSYAVPRFPTPIFRTAAFMALKITRSGLVWMKWRLFPCCTMLEPGDTEWSADNDEKAVLKFTPVEDQVSGSARFNLEDGPGWRALGGATLPPGTPVATAGATGVVTLTTTEPLSPNGPFTYVAYKGGTGSPITPTTVGGTAADPILTLSGQASGATTYTLQAIGSNGTTSAQTAASNSVTVA